jgi:hypothetical protein
MVTPSESNVFMVIPRLEVKRQARQGVIPADGSPNICT